ncbi:MAG: AAA family ATPase [Clostridia bacterium]|nr:AAA family ATPase [Clostridia bacterium]
MGTYFNLGNGRFQDCLDRKIFVDKSGIIEYTNECISEKEKYLCVTRPRRFGKSTTANMLVAYYSRGCDSHSQFDGLAISKSEGYADFLNTFNLIRIDMSRLLGDWGPRYTIAEILDNLKHLVISELAEEYPDIKYERLSLTDYIEKIYSVTHVRFVFVIDEWDAVFRSRKGDIVGHTDYIEFLNALLKEQEYVALAYMTGIYPIRRYGNESALNMFKEISMMDAEPIQTYTGFTQDEVESLCDKFGRSFVTMKWWYNGYNVEGIPIYNPKAVDEAVKTGVFKNYWTKTQEYESLKGYIEINRFGIHDAVVNLLAGDKVGIDVAGFFTDIESFTTRDEILALLVHLGYLTFDSATKTVWIPNHEITDEFDTIVKQIKLKTALKSDAESEKLYKATLSKDADTVNDIVSRMHQENSDSFTVGNEISLKTVISLAYSYARGYYSIVHEMPVLGGRADFVFIPTESSPDLPLIIIEAKDNDYDTADDAIKQIRKNKYMNCLPAYRGKILLVGISYNTERKEYTSVIEEEVKTQEYI